MKIAQVSAAQTAGGAERVAVDLHECFREAGHDAVLLTPRPNPSQPMDGVIPIDVDARRPRWQRALSHLDRRLARPWAAWRRRRGYDDYNFPWTAGLLDLLPWEPDVLHLHNLHGGWFDLRQLAPLSHRVPTVLTLHDASLLTGGPHVFCVQDRWNQGALRRNRQQRAAVFSGSRLHVVTPSRWMRDRATESDLARAAARLDVIPNGVDLDRFSPFDESELEPPTDLDDTERLLGVGLTGRGALSHALPEALIEDASWLVAEDDDRWALLVVLVGARRPRSLWWRHARSVDWAGTIRDRRALRRRYTSAVILAHYVREDNFPSVILEAMACGTPVMAPRVGGIPEQFTDGVHGRMYDVDDVASRRRILRDTLADAEARYNMGSAAAEHARRSFDRRRMAADYLSFYREVAGTPPRG